MAAYIAQYKKGSLSRAAYAKKIKSKRQKAKHRVT